LISFKADSESIGILASLKSKGSNEQETMVKRMDELGIEVD